jgi:hypothetical protein
LFCAGLRSGEETELDRQRLNLSSLSLPSSFLSAVATNEYNWPVHVPYFRAEAEKNSL